MKILMTAQEMLHKANDWDALCEEIGLNPWCINEGLVSDDEEFSISEEIARKQGLIN
jgi:hypothetical protein